MEGYLADLFSHWLLVAPYVRYLERQIERQKAARAGLDEDSRNRSDAHVELLEQEIRRQLPIVRGEPWDPDEVTTDFVLKALAVAVRRSEPKNARNEKKAAARVPRK